MWIHKKDYRLTWKNSPQSFFIKKSSNTCILCSNICNNVGLMDNVIGGGNVSFLLATVLWYSQPANFVSRFWSYRHVMWWWWWWHLAQGWMSIRTAGWDQWVSATARINSGYSGMLMSKFCLTATLHSSSQCLRVDVIFCYTSHDPDLQCPNNATMKECTWLLTERANMKTIPLHAVTEHISPHIRSLSRKSADSHVRLEGMFNCKREFHMGSWEPYENNFQRVISYSLST